MSFFNKDDADALKVVNHSLVLDIWNRLRKNRIVVVIICNKEILVCVQQTQWEGSRGVGVQCALLLVGKRVIAENGAVNVIAGRNHCCPHHIGVFIDTFDFDWLTCGFVHLLSCTSDAWPWPFHSSFWCHW